MQIKPKDVMAFLVIVGYFIAKWQNFNGEVNTAFMLILGYYFVKRQDGKDSGN